MSTLSEYLQNMQTALKTPGARALYFPPNAAQRRQQNLRLAREIGPALAAFPAADVEKALSSLYSTLIVMHSLDTTGVQIDNKDFLAELRTSIADWRDRASRPPEPALLAQR